MGVEYRAVCVVFISCILNLCITVHFNFLFLISGSREEEAIKLDGLSVSEMKQLRDQAEKFAFQAEVNRMMKLIINSLYRNKEVSAETFIRLLTAQFNWLLMVHLIIILFSNYFHYNLNIMILRMIV